MTIDGFTLVAQIVNFLILLLLLRRFLYGPIVNIMREREARIAEAHEKAEGARAEAEGEAKRLRSERDELERTRDERMAEIERQAHEHEHALHDEARHAVERARERWRASLQEDQDTVLDGLRSDAGRLLHEAVASALEDLAELNGADLDARIAHALARRLGELEQTEVGPFRAALEAGSELRVSSATELPDDAREALERAVRTHLDARAELHFDPRPELLAGVVLEVRDHRLSWNLRRYLDELERDFRTALSRSAGETHEGGGTDREAGTGGDGDRTMATAGVHQTPVRAPRAAAEEADASASEAR